MSNAGDAAELEREPTYGRVTDELGRPCVALTFYPESKPTLAISTEASDVLRRVTYGLRGDALLALCFGLRAAGFGTPELDELLAANT